MRTSTLLLAAAILGAAAAFAAEGETAKPADVPLPFNPAAGAASGDWARYRISDPAAPDEPLAEHWTVLAVEGARVRIVDALGKVHVYPSEAGPVGALAYLRGFFGEEGATLADAVRALAVTPDPVEAGGRTYADAVRIDATVEVPGAGDEVWRAEFRIWVAPAVKAAGVVRATATVTAGARTHAGTLTLESDGTAAEAPPKGGTPRGAAPAAPTGTAAPAGG